MAAADHAAYALSFSIPCLPKPCLCYCKTKLMLLS